MRLELDKTFLVSEFDNLKDFNEKQHNKFICLILLLFKNLQSNKPRVASIDILELKLLPSCWQAAQPNPRPLLLLRP